MVGMEDIWAYPRFGYTQELIRGFNFVPALIGLFGLSEVLMVLKMKKPYKLLGDSGWVTINVRLIGKYFKTIIRSVFVAVGIGIVPGVGESAACWLGYDLACKGSKNKENFGKGEIEGVIAAEAANSATSGGALIPSLVFGIPGSGPTALLIAAMFMYGIRPGPMLMLEKPGFVAEIVVLFWMAAIFTRLGAMLISPTFIAILSKPPRDPLAHGGGFGCVGRLGGRIHHVRYLFHAGLRVIRLFAAAAQISLGSHGAGHPGGALCRFILAPGAAYLQRGYFRHAHPALCAYTFGFPALHPVYPDQGVDQKG